jgi:asparaginyl-tRNA synthetase
MHSIQFALDDESLTNTTITVAGWVRTFRNDRFIALNDGSTIRNLQCVIDQKEVDAATLARFTTGAAVQCTGELVPSQGSGQRVEMKVTAVEVIGDCPAEKYPIQPKKHSLEFLRENAHLRFRTNTYSAVFRMRHQVSFGIHEYFDTHGYNYFHAPIITASDAEGAGEMFRVSTLDAKQPPLNESGEVDFKEDFFGAESRLTVSGQLQAEPPRSPWAKCTPSAPRSGRRTATPHATSQSSGWWNPRPPSWTSRATWTWQKACASTSSAACCATAWTTCSSSMRGSQKKRRASHRTNAAEMGLIDRLNFVLENPFERITYDDAINILLRSKPYQKRNSNSPWNGAWTCKASTSVTWWKSTSRSR